MCVPKARAGVLVSSCGGGRPWLSNPGLPLARPAPLDPRFGGGARTHSLSAGCPAACLLAAATAPCTPLESREEGARPLVRPCCLASLGRWRPRWNAVLRPLSALLCCICDSDSAALPSFPHFSAPALRATARSRARFAFARSHSHMLAATHRLFSRCAKI